MTATFNFANFVLGLQAQFDPSKPLQDGYALLSNGRVRNNVVEVVRSPVEDDTLPTGKRQGVYAIGSFLIVFVAGGLWYRDVSTDNAFVLLATPPLDADVDYIYLEQIPATTVQYKRAGDIAATTFNNTAISTHAAGLIVTDGINQPIFVYPTVTGGLAARITNTYAQYTNDDREYVPIGICPRMIGQKLYMVAKDDEGRYTRIYQSVTGRPLDFVIAINDDGSKNGDATIMAHSVGMDEITALAPAQDDEAFFAFTETATYLITVDYINSILFAEPRLRTSPLFPVGVRNPFSFASRNGELTFIHRTGISTFNTVLQLRNESNNEPISRAVQRLIKDKVQTTSAAVNDDDYMFLAINTIHGPGILVYDNTLGQYVSLDIYRNVGAIKMFAKTTQATGDRLFFVTDTGLFEFGAGTDYETTRLYVGDWFSQDAAEQFRPQSITPVFTNVNEDTEVRVTLYIDRREVEKSAYSLKGAAIEDTPTSPMPSPIASGPRNVPVTVTHTHTGECWSFGYMIEWRGDATLAGITTQTAKERRPTHTNARYEVMRAAVQRFYFFADSAPNNDIEDIVGNGILIGGGDHLYDSGTQDDYNAAFVNRWLAGPTFHLALGNHDLDTDGGKVFLDNFGGQRYYKVSYGNVDWFFLNGGYTTAAVTLDVNRDAGAPDAEPDGNLATEKQAQWLRRELRNSTARFKFVVIHEPPYTNEVNYYPGYRRLRWPFRTWGATAVFSGHAHVYERFNVDGLPYYVVGTGGHSLRQFLSSSTPNEFEARQNESYGVLEIITNGFNATTRFIRTDGTSYDRNIIHS